MAKYVGDALGFWVVMNDKNIKVKYIKKHEACRKTCFDSDLYTVWDTECLQKKNPCY